MDSFNIWMQKQKYEFEGKLSEMYQKISIMDQIDKNQKLNYSILPDKGEMRNDI